MLTHPKCHLAERASHCKHRNSTKVCPRAFRFASVTMVLDDASPQAGPLPNNNASPSKPAGPPMSPNPVFAKYFPLKIKPELVIKPDLFTLYFGFFGVNKWRRNVADALADRVETQWLITNRSPTQDEMDVYTTAASRALYYKTIGVPCAAYLSTGWIAYKTIKDHSWMKGKTPVEWLALARTNWKADSYNFMRSAGRSAFNVFFWTCLGGTISSFAGSLSEVKTLLQDPRAQQYMEGMKTADKDELRRRKMYAAVDRARRIKSGERPINARIEDDLSHGSGYDQDQYNYDNAASNDVQSESDMAYSTSQYDQQNYPTEASRPQVYGRPQGMSNQPASQPDNGSDFFFDDDDASPTAREYRNTNIDGSSTGSAWERVRHQNLSGSQQHSSPNRMQPWGRPQNTLERDSAPANDQDRYNLERTRDKEQAHAEFNRMVEAEKIAYSDTSSQNRGWGS